MNKNTLIFFYVEFIFNSIDDLNVFAFDYFEYLLFSFFSLLNELFCLKNSVCANLNQCKRRIFQVKEFYEEFY